MAKQIDWSKPIRCKDGRPARVLATDLKGEYPVAVACDAGDEEHVELVTANGLFYTDDTEPYVENIPERFEYVRWVNVYQDGAVGTRLYYDKESARIDASTRCINTVSVTISGEREV